MDFTDKQISPLPGITNHALLSNISLQIASQPPHDVITLHETFLDQFEFYSQHDKMCLVYQNNFKVLSKQIANYSNFKEI